MGNVYQFNAGTGTVTEVGTGATDVLLGNSVNVWAINGSKGTSIRGSKEPRA
jgi:hypothetical protein